MRKNCWEFKKCGREPGGARVHELGVCPSPSESRLHGTHGGRNGGRACWVVAGTFCNGSVQGTFAVKYTHCFACDFYTYVQKNEGTGFLMTPILLKKVKADQTLSEV